MKKLRKLWCHWRGYHTAAPPFLKILDDDLIPTMILLPRTCKCGAETIAKLIGELRPGGLVEYEQTWPA